MKRFSTLILLTLSAHLCFAQESLDDTESFFNRAEEEASKEPSIQEKKPENAGAAAAAANANAKVRDISDLQNLAPFKDIAVIQKRFLPKTGRFELFGGLGSTLNDAFFIDATANIRLGYYFRERYAIEFSGMGITSANRTVTDALANHGVTTSSLVAPKSFFGGDFKWIPIYGKMALTNKGITPFDMYFSLGAGSTTTNNGSSPTVHLGTGQTFAMTKAFALRWDFSWNFYSATTYLDAAHNQQSSGSFNNLFVLVGASFFFPEATYR